MEKTACFIDGDYFKNVLRNFGEPRIDFLKLIERMKGNNALLRAYYYNCKCFVSENPTEEELIRRAKQESFFHALQTKPQIECKFGKLEQRPEDGSFAQKQVDVLMAIDIVTLSVKHLITQAKIITGDSDLIPAIQRAKDEGVVVELFFCPGSAHHELLQIVDISTEIDFDLIEKITIR